MNPTENTDTKKETVQSASAEKTTTVEDYFYLNPNADKDFKIKSSDKALEGNILEYIKWRKKQIIAEIQRGDVVSSPVPRNYIEEYNEQNPNNTIANVEDVKDINNYAEKTLVTINSSDTLKQIMQTTSNESQILTTGNYNISSGRYTANRGQSPKAIAESLLTEGMACVGLPMTITLDTSKESKKIEEIAKFCAQRGIDASQITIKHSKGIEQLNEIEAVKDITATIKQVNGGIAHAFDNDYAMAEEMLQNPSNEQIDQLNIDDSNESTWLNIAKMETGSTFEDDCKTKYLQKQAIKEEIPNISADTDTLAWDLKALDDQASSTPATDINIKLDAIMKQHELMGVDKNTLVNNDSLSKTREAYFNADNSANIAADLKAGKITIATIESNIGPKGEKSSRDVIQEEYTALSNEINKIERDSSGITPEEVRSASILSKMLGNRMQGSLQAKIANVDKTFEKAAADTFGGVIRDQKPIGTQVVLGRMIRDKEINGGDWKNPQILGKDEAHIAPEHLAPLLKTYNEVTGKNVLTLDIRNKIEENIHNINDIAETNMTAGKEEAIKSLSRSMQTIGLIGLDAKTRVAIATKVISKHFMSNGDLKNASIRDNIKIQADLMAEYRNHIVNTYGLTNFDATLSDNKACYKKHNKEQQQRGNYAVSKKIHEQLKGLTKEINDFEDQSEAILSNQFTPLGPNPQPNEIEEARKNFEDKANIPAEIRGTVKIPHTDLQKLTGGKPEDRLNAANKILQKYKTAATNEANRIKQEFNIPANTDLIQIKADNELPAQVKEDNTIKEEDLKKECEKALKVSNLYDSQHRGAQELTHIIKINQGSSGFTNDTIAIAAYRTVYEKLGDPATAKTEDINTQIANTLKGLGFEIDGKDKSKLEELQAAFEQTFKPDEQAAVATVTNTAKVQQEATAAAAPSTGHKTQIDEFKEKLAQLRANAKESKKQIQDKGTDNHVEPSTKKQTGGGATK